MTDQLFAAHVGERPGKLLIAFAPAGKMEAFFRDNAKRQKEGEYLNDRAVYRAYGLELLGPPLSRYEFAGRGRSRFATGV